jgi:hypothetical protein
MAKKNQQAAYVRSYPQDDEVVELLIQGLTERGEYFLSPGGHWLRGDWRNHSFLRPAQNVMILGQSNLAIETASLAEKQNYTHHDRNYAKHL